ncbi:TonB-dependent receptor [Winogradskyella psychrotolerans]|uniref:TonB-dependent receptor n=1 Tax=Winogradskyella psychrotolerans TaxID=1344585 RepID=UPI001C06ECD3|nr:TonB-dependent receptor [Winogradskyella psychrotolerans]MBU2922570.1 TonB-dependent receptor [Winogradskyella psychrotolerans]
MKHLFTLLVFSLFSLVGFSQTGVVTGKIYDAEFNDLLPFANIVVKNTTIGTTSDFDGNYELELDPGTYVLVYSFVGYQPKEITDVVIEENTEVTINVTLNPSSESLDEVIVSTSIRRNSEAAVLNLQRKSVNLFDGLSIETMKKSGASNVASAVKSVPGVSLQDGKFVYVRGLGDRYTKSILNGMDIPGLDPDRNTVQLDIFPSNLIENIIVYKTLTADLPADFTGGVVDIVTKDFSSREEYNLSVGVGYNPSMHFNSDFITQSKSGTDFLGFDNGLRDDPIALGASIPALADNSPRLTELTRRFEPEMAAQNDTSFMNYNFGFSTSNQIEIGDHKLGYIAAISYNAETTLYDDYTQNFLFKPQSLSETELVPNRLQKGYLSEENVLISGLAGVTYKRDFSKYKVVFTKVQNGTAKTGKFEQESFITNAALFYSDNLEYTEKTVNNLLLSGTHVFSAESSNELDWSVSGTNVKVNDKDVRSTLFEYDDGQYIIRPSIGEPRRIWRNLEENNLSSKLNFTKKHQLFNKDAKFKAGLAQVYKERDFDINQYSLRIDGTPAAAFSGNPDNLLISENIWTTDNSGGTYVVSNFEPANTFNAYATTYAAYVSEEFKITDKLKSVLGLRFEKYDSYYTGSNTIGDINFNDERIIDEADLFPSLNLIFSLNDNTNLRLSYAKSTARPSFKEASVAQIFDPISNITFNGNIDLKTTYVDNFDIRYEIFSEDAGLLALSGFYKSFDNPIELTIFGLEAINDVIPRNIGDAKVYGVELEFRRNLGFIYENLNSLSFNTNISVIESEQTMNEAEYEGRLSAARDGEEIDDKRQLQGQSPYLINAGLSYSKNGIQSGIYYNVQGETLQIVGIGQVSDVYTDPFHSLNFNFSKSFGEKENRTITLKVDNILNDEIRSNYQSYNAEDQIFSNYSPGVEFSLSYAIKF